MIVGENLRLAHSDTGSPTLDAFFGIVPGVAQAELFRLLGASWATDPESTLRIIFNTGNCRRDEFGKCDQRNFEMALLWLWREHPNTLVTNMQQVN
jgi:hypothetical protein